MIVKDRIQRVKGELNKFSEALRGQSHFRKRRGNAAPEIIKTACDLDADLILISTNGRTGLPQLFLGSVAERVVRESPCPVLTVRALKQKTDEKN